MSVKTGQFDEKMQKAACGSSHLCASIDGTLQVRLAVLKQDSLVTNATHAD